MQNVQHSRLVMHKLSDLYYVNRLIVRGLGLSVVNVSAKKVLTLTFRYTVSFDLKGGRDDFV